MLKSYLKPKSIIVCNSNLKFISEHPSLKIYFNLYQDSSNWKKVSMSEARKNLSSKYVIGDCKGITHS